MSKATPGPAEGSARVDESTSAHWPVLKVSVPPDWKTWLEQAAAHRALSVAGLVRQCIRELMIQRRPTDKGPTE